MSLLESLRQAMLEVRGSGPNGKGRCFGSMIISGVDGQRQLLVEALARCCLLGT
jgi:hypothetical protein